MSDDGSGMTAAEKGLAGTSHGVASFEEDSHSALRRLQHFLPAYPTALPFIVLILGVLIFSVAAGGRVAGPVSRARGSVPDPRGAPPTRMSPVPRGPR